MTRDRGPRVALIGVVVLVVATLSVLWLAISRREAKLLEARAPTTTPLLTSPAHVPCNSFGGLDFASQTWVSNEAVAKAGWSAPLHTIESARDRVPVEVVETSHGTVVWVQASGGGGGEGGPDDPGFAHWLARVESGPIDGDSAPRAVVQRAEIRAFSPYVGALGDGFFMASGAQGGVLEKLDPSTLRTVRRRQNVAPRTATLPAMRSFIPDGAGGIFFLSYGDTGARLHHVDANLDDVVPARFFTVPLQAGQHWNPAGLGLADDRICVKLSCWKSSSPSAPSSDCGERYVVVDRRFEPAVHEMVRIRDDPGAARVRWLGYGAAAVLFLALVYLQRWLASWIVIRRSPVEAEILRVDDASITVRDGDDVITIAKPRLALHFATRRGADALAAGPCVIPARSSAPRGYRGTGPGPVRKAEEKESSSRVPIAPGTLAAVTRRAEQRLTRALLVACVLQLAIAGVAAKLSWSSARTERLDSTVTLEP